MSNDSSKKIVSAMWQKYEAAAIPEDVGFNQRKVMCHTFYTGAACMIGTLEILIKDCPDKATQIRAIAALKSEITNYLNKPWH